MREGPALTWRGHGPRAQPEGRPLLRSDPHHPCVGAGHVGNASRLSWLNPPRVPRRRRTSPSRLAPRGLCASSGTPSPSPHRVGAAAGGRDSRAMWQEPCPPTSPSPSIPPRGTFVPISQMRKARRTRPNDFAHVKCMFEPTHSERGVVATA